MWNQQYEPYSEEYLARFRNVDPDGRKWQDGPITAKGCREEVIHMSIKESMVTGDAPNQPWKGLTRITSCILPRTVGLG